MRISEPTLRDFLGLCWIFKFFNFVEGLKLSAKAKIYEQRV